MEDKQAFSRPLVVAVAVFLLAIIAGRLMLHPTPGRVAVLLIVIPALFFLLLVKSGAKNALAAIVFLVLMATAVRYLLDNSSWLVLLLAPFLLLNIVIAVHVVRVVLGERHQAKMYGGEEREEE